MENIEEGILKLNRGNCGNLMQLRLDRRGMKERGSSIRQFTAVGGKLGECAGFRTESRKKWETIGLDFALFG